MSERTLASRRPCFEMSPRWKLTIAWDGGTVSPNGELAALHRRRRDVLSRFYATSCYSLIAGCQSYETLLAGFVATLSHHHTFLGSVPAIDSPAPSWIDWYSCSPPSTRLLASSGSELYLIPFWKGNIAQPSILPLTPSLNFLHRLTKGGR